MEKIRMQVSVINDESKLVYHNPIVIPPSTERVFVGYSYSPEYGDEGARNEIDLALAASGKDIGTRGSDVWNVEVSESYSTDGFIRIKPEGVWDVMIIRGKLFSPEIKVVLEIGFEPAVRRYYKGDTHAHTVNSDGKLTQEALLKKAKKKGLEYLMVTDHNRPAVYGLPAVKGVTAIPGVETTYFKGHANFWGAEKPYEKSFALNTLEEWRRLRDEARSNGAIICVNHPFCSMCPWRWELDPDDFDAVEVLNGPARDDTQKAVEWWEARIKEGKRLVPVGGSDYHRNYFVVSTLGIPVTYVYSRSGAASDILEAVKEGRTAVSVSMRHGLIDLKCGDAVVGDTLKFTGKDEVKISVRKLKRGERLVVINGGEILFEHTAKRTGDYSVSVTPVKAGAVYAKIVNRYRGVKRLLFDIVLSVMLPSQAFKKHGEYVFALSAPIWFE